MMNMIKGALDPKQVTIIPPRTVRDHLGHEPTAEELDLMAENGAFLDRWDHLYYDIHGTFKEEQVGI